MKGVIAGDSIHAAVGQINLPAIERKKTGPEQTFTEDGQLRKKTFANVQSGWGNITRYYLTPELA
jgi:hypothetical protein